MLQQSKHAMVNLKWVMAMIIGNRDGKIHGVLVWLLLLLLLPGRAPVEARRSASSSRVAFAGN